MGNGNKPVAWDILELTASKILEMTSVASAAAHIGEPPPVIDIHHCRDSVFEMPFNDERKNVHVETDSRLNQLDKMPPTLVN